MPRSLVAALSITDTLFLAYWSLSGLVQAGALNVPRDWMYAGYDQPRVVAWNWSFLPLDLAFLLLGLSAVYAARRRRPVWRPLALLSLAFTMAAGGMAIGYWLLLDEYDPDWFWPNLALVLWPLLFLPRLISGTAAPPAAGAGSSPAQTAGAQARIVFRRTVGR